MIKLSNILKEIQIKKPIRLPKSGEIWIRNAGPDSDWGDKIEWKFIGVYDDEYHFIRPGVGLFAGVAHRTLPQIIELIKNKELYKKDFND